MSSEKTASYNLGGRSSEEALLALARRIRSEREQKGISQEDFAENCGLHRTAIGLLERGKSIPRLDTLLWWHRGLVLVFLNCFEGLSDEQEEIEGRGD
jgi:transcriptional regulator with XRE-family HTH domain